MSVTAKVVATTKTVPNAHGVAPQQVVGIPPSAADAAAGKVRVYINGVLVMRDYNPELEQP